MYIYLTNVLMPSIPLQCKVSQNVILIFWRVLPKCTLVDTSLQECDVLLCSLWLQISCWRWHAEACPCRRWVTLFCRHSKPSNKITQLYYQSTKLNNVAVCVICTLYLATQGLCNPWTRLLIFIAFVPLFGSVVVKRGASISYYSKMGKYIFSNVC